MLTPRKVDPYMRSAKPREIVNNFHGRVFNSLNDVAVHVSTGYIFFTDPDYGHEQGFKLRPQLPNAVWRFHPDLSSVQMVADGLAKPNGIAFSPDEKTCFITDTDYIHGDGDRDGHRAGTMCAVPSSPAAALNSSRYAFDVNTEMGVPTLHNRRVFAFADCGAPDGIKCDVDGNVYTGCFDGVHVCPFSLRLPLLTRGQVFAPSGELIGKIVLPPDAQGRQRGCANLVFTEPGKLVILAETTVWEAGIAAVGDPKRHCSARPP